MASSLPYKLNLATNQVYAASFSNGLGSSAAPQEMVQSNPNRRTRTLLGVSLQIHLRGGAAKCVPDVPQLRGATCGADSTRLRPKA